MTYVSTKCWSVERPRTLVVCCSDGRLQESVDEFLGRHLNVLDYDRLYAPGGPAALADSSSEFTRSNLFRRDCEFLFNAHQIESVVLIFHGSADDGPEEAVCAHYRRVMPGRPKTDIALRQRADMGEVRRHVRTIGPRLSVEAYLAEVLSDGKVRFVGLDGASP